MNNLNAERELNNCKQELDQILSIMRTLGIFHVVTPYLTKYALIKVCGTIEFSYKIIIFDFCRSNQNRQLRTFLEAKFFNVAIALYYDNICKNLSLFDRSWRSAFKRQIMINGLIGRRLQSSLNSLSSCRNDFAHGGNPSVSFSDVVHYFIDSQRAIEILDRIIV